MESGRRPGAFSPKFTSSSPPSPRPLRDRSFSVDSDSSASSQTTNMSQPGKRGPTPTQPARPTVYTSPRSNTSTPTVLQNYSRPTIAHVVSDIPARRNSPLNPGIDRSHKRNNSQGFFEPSLPTLADSPTALTSTMPVLTPSQIAAQAAMQAQNASTDQLRRRSLTTPSPVLGQESNKAAIGQAKPMPQPTAAPQAHGQMLPPGSRKGSTSAASNLGPSNGIMGPPGAAAASAASAASAAYPGSVRLSPGLTSFASMTDLPSTAGPTPRSKAERAKQIFTKSKQITVPNAKELDRKDKLGPVTAKLPSPGPSIYQTRTNASTTSLSESITTAAPSIYSGANASTSTLVPSERQMPLDMVPPPAPTPVPPKEKESRHRTGIFSRPKKNKEEHPLTLSSAASNSKPVDPNAPASIYSFAPSSPAPSQMGFGKVGGHGVKKKKDEFDFGSAFGPATTATGHFVGGTPVGYESAYNALQGFGLNHMTPEDAWDFLKAKLLVIYEGGEVRIPVEDLNRLVSVHIQRCVQRRAPTLVIEDLRDLLGTGFASLDMTLRRIADERLVPQLVDMWLFVFGTILPYMQAVFLPLDLELRGRGTMSPKDAMEFWGLPNEVTNGGVSDGDELDVRSMVLLAFRDDVILPRHDILKQVFSRLSLESINIFPDSPLPMPPFGAPPSGRPGTAGSIDPTQSSFNSQGSTLISDSSRSRATSNTSAPELPTFSPTMPPRPGTGGQGSSVGTAGGGPPDSSQVTETVGRMLQCMSVLVSIHSGDEAQEKMEDLTKTLKLNWLGRGRTGRNRKGLVGARVPRRATPVIG